MEIRRLKLLYFRPNRQGGIKYAENERVWFCLFLHKIRSYRYFMQEKDSIIAIA